VRKAVDFWDEKEFGPFVSETDKLPRNVVQLFTENFIITIRPSGTEPKLKFYCQLLPGEKPSDTRGVELLQEVRAEADGISLKIYNDLLKIIGLSLSEAALLIPDIVDLDRKQTFDRETTPKLKEALAKETFSKLEDVLAWLRKETASMTPGADPLPALKAPITHLCGLWMTQPNAGKLCGELEKWAEK
jgi:hypothetical protein